jgi:hypothetical protein
LLVSTPNNCAFETCSQNWLVLKQWDLNGLHQVGRAPVMQEGQTLSQSPE